MKSLGTCHNIGTVQGFIHIFCPFLFLIFFGKWFLGIMLSCRWRLLPTIIVFCSYSFSIILILVYGLLLNYIWLKILCVLILTCVFVFCFYFQDPTNAKVILCDSRLQQLFGCEMLSALGVSAMLSQHLFKQS